MRPGISAWSLFYIHFTTFKFNNLLSTYMITAFLIKVWQKIMLLLLRSVDHYLAHDRYLLNSDATIFLMQKPPTLSKKVRRLNHL